MASYLNLATLLLTSSTCIASDISFSCNVKSGPEVTGIGEISTVSCNQDETMVSCGIEGIQNIGGSWMENNVCTALSHYNGYSGSWLIYVQAKARCCTFPEDAILSTSIISSVEGQSVSSTCSSDDVLTGCQVYYTSGDYNKVRGSFAGPFTTLPQTTTWIPTDNQCNAASYSSGTVKAGATCLSLNEGYSLDCTTKAAYTNRYGFGSCEDGYTIMSCNTFTNSRSLDAYYITDDADCYIQQDDHDEMYGNGICCKLMSSGDCPPLNTDTSNSGRCGPLFGSVRCNMNLEDYAVYCNSDNGWCGVTDDHRYAQPDEDIYDWNPTSCNAVSATTYDSSSNEYYGISNVECGDEEIDPTFHIGDVLLDVRDVIDDICSSIPGQILIKALSVIPYTKAIGAGAEAMCSSISALNSICDLFTIGSCTTLDKMSSIVASCWSSDAFKYRNSSAKDAFKYYLSSEYDITATFGYTEAVSNEKYHATKVSLDNCGNSDNNWIAGVYEADDNAEQNDIVSDVVEYLVNQGIASVDNPVGGVSSVDQSAYDGVTFTDVVRSSQGLLLHYDEGNVHTNHGLYFCEFNVIDFDGSDMNGQMEYHPYPVIPLVVLTLMISI